jgi:hypothetical protein
MKGSGGSFGDPPSTGFIKAGLKTRLYVIA